MVTNEPKQQKAIQHQFDSFCKTVLKNEARNIYYETNKQNQKMVLLSALNQDQLNQLGICEIYATDVYYFYFKDYEIKVEDSLIANAIQSLPERSQLVILFSFFLDIVFCNLKGYKIAMKRLELCQPVFYYD